MSDQKSPEPEKGLPEKAADFLEDVEQSGIINTGKNFLRSVGALLHGDRKETKAEDQTPRDN